MRVAFVLRSAEVQLLFRRFVRDLSSVIRHQTCLVNSPPPPKHNQHTTPKPPTTTTQKPNPPNTRTTIPNKRSSSSVYNLKEETKTQKLYVLVSSLFTSRFHSPGTFWRRRQDFVFFFSKSKLDTSLDRGKSHTKKTSDQDPSWCQVLYEELLCSSAVRFCLAHTVLLWIKC